MLVVATSPSDLERVQTRLVELGARIDAVVAPAERRRVVVSSVPVASTESIAVLLRAEGEMAVARPDGGAAGAAWHRNTTPVTVADRVTVCLAWSEHERHELPGLVELGPGGFGSGHHPTTRLLIEALARRLRGGESVLDVGCGTGVLALAALELGAGRGLGVDLKAEAVEATRRNAALNDRTHELTASDQLPIADGEVFDVVLANIARAGIVELRADLVRLVAPSGWLGVSGLTPMQCDQVAGHLSPLVTVERQFDGDWAALVLARDA